MTSSAEYRSALAALESSVPVLQRILKAAVAGSSILETLEAQQAQLEKNIAGLKQREERAQASAGEAKKQGERAVEDSMAAIAQSRAQEERLKKAIADQEQRLVALNTQVRQRTSDLKDLERAIEDIERRNQAEYARAARIAAAVEAASK